MSKGWRIEPEPSEFTRRVAIRRTWICAFCRATIFPGRPAYAMENSHSQNCYRSKLRACRKCAGGEDPPTR